MCLFLCYYYTNGCHWLLNWSCINNYFDSESYWFYIYIKKVFFLVLFTSIWRVYLHMQETKRAHDWRKPATRKGFCFKINLFKEWMKKLIALLTKEKRLRMNGKMMNLPFFELYTVYIKIMTLVFPYLLVNLFKERHISSVNSYKYLIMSYELNMSLMS